MSNPWAEEGVALLEKAAGQGHAYAMDVLGGVFRRWKEHERSLAWYAKGAEAGLPTAMFNYGRGLHSFTFELNLSRS